MDIRRRPSVAMVDSFAQFDGLGWDFTPGTPPVDGACYDFDRYWPGASADGGRRRGTHRFLARMTEFIEVESGLPSRFTEHVRTGRDGYDVEHLWAKDHWSLYRDDFEQRDRFHGCRNNIAGLVLLPHVVNVLLSDKAYKKKREAYKKHRHLDPQRRPENLLARSLAIEPAEEPGSPLRAAFRAAVQAACGVPAGGPTGAGEALRPARQVDLEYQQHTRGGVVVARSRPLAGSGRRPAQPPAVRGEPRFAVECSGL